MSNCLFCNIVSGNIPAEKIYEDDDILAFLDINPVNPGHILVIPKEHHESFLKTPDELLGALLVAAKKIGTAVKDTTGATGINIVVNNGKDAGQEIPHTHIHVIPRTPDDGHAHWHGTPYPDEHAARSLAKQMRDALT